MRYIQNNEKGKKCSVIGLGCMRIANSSLEDIDTLIHTCLDEGINFIDEADIYGGGKSEELLGEVLKTNPNLREKLYIQSKCGIRDGYFDFSKEYILQAVEGSLTRLHTDHLDSLLLHRPDILMEPDEVNEAFEILYQSGKVLSFGVSNTSIGQMDYLQKGLKQKITVNQMQMSCAHTVMIDGLLHEDMIDTRSIKHDSGIIPYCQLHDIVLQVWSPLQKGYFEGIFFNDPQYKNLCEKLEEIGNKYNVGIDTIAYAWLLRIPCNIQVVVGTTNSEHIKNAAKASEILLTRKEWYEIYTSAGNKLP